MIPPREGRPSKTKEMLREEQAIISSEGGGLEYGQRQKEEAKLMEER